MSFHVVVDERLTPKNRPWRCTCGARCMDECLCDRPTGIEDEDPTEEPKPEPFPRCHGGGTLEGDAPETAADFAWRWAADRVQDMREQVGRGKPRDI